MTPGVTVIIATFPARAALLSRAIHSIQAGTRPADSIIIASDNLGEGEAITRTRALMQVQTEWTAVLDDDDEFGRHHLIKLLTHAVVTGADLVWSWFEVIGGTDPHPANLGREFDIENPHHITSTTLYRTDLAQQVGGYLYPDDGPQDRVHDGFGPDWTFAIKMANAGARMRHLPEHTWAWHHDSGNTSGLVQNR